MLLTPSYAFSATCPSTTSDFVTRVGTTLCHKGNVFKFASFNMPGLTMVEDPVQQFDPVSQQWNPLNHDQFRAPTKEELQDAIDTLVQMGTKVTRIYPPTISSSENTDQQSYFTWDSSSDQFVLNAALFQNLDYLLELAKENNIKKLYSHLLMQMILVMVMVEENGEGFQPSAQNLDNPVREKITSLFTKVSKHNL